MIAPQAGERPAAYADRAGRAYAAGVAATHKKGLGQYLTPLAVADFMARWVDAGSASLRVLDPGSGAGVLSCALAEALAGRAAKPRELHLAAYECDANLVPITSACLDYLRDWLQPRGVRFTYELCTDDFVLANADVLDARPALFPARQRPADFDVVIANPPYLKIAKSDPRAQAASAVVHGQPNLYALFMRHYRK
jgi:adenine-specific DNA-methyltransferase